MSDATRAATTSTPNDNLRARLREICMVELTTGAVPYTSGIRASWSRWSNTVCFKRDPNEPYQLKIAHIEMAIKEAVDGLTQVVWYDYMAIEELMEQK